MAELWCVRSFIASSGKGYRDLYLVHSNDLGEPMEQAVKLGKGSWKLDGCPMDGGALAINAKGVVQTVWRRESKIYKCEPNKTETMVGQGRSCAIASCGDKNIYAWSDEGKIVCLLPGGELRVVGRGGLPVVKAIDNGRLVLVWENDKKIESRMIAF